MTIRSKPYNMPCGDNPKAICNGGNRLYCTPACLSQQHQRNYNYYTDPNMPCGEIILPTMGACTIGTNDKGEIDLPIITYAEAQTHPSYETVKRVRTAEHELSFASDDDEMPDVIRDELNEIRRQLENFLNTRILPYWRNSSGFNPAIRG